MKKLQVEENTSVLIKDVSSQGDEVVVEYDDGHKAIFEPYSHGCGYQCEGLRSFTLFKGDREVFLYHSRLCYSGLREDEYKIIHIDNNYSQKDVAKYWRSAKSYLSWRYSNNPGEQDKLWWSWRLICGEGGIDLNWLEKGTAEILKT